MAGESTYLTFGHNFNMAKFDKEFYAVALMRLTMWKQPDDSADKNTPEDLRKYSMFSWCFAKHYCHHEVEKSTSYYCIFQQGCILLAHTSNYF